MSFRRGWKCLTCFGEHWSEDEIAACRDQAAKGRRTLTADEMREAIRNAPTIKTDD